MLLNQVVDSLYLRAGALGPPSAWITAQSVLWRDHKNAESFDTPELTVELPDLGTFRVLRRGDRPYEFIITNPEIADIRIWNPQRWNSKQACETGQLYVVFRSRWMQLYGLARAHEFCQQLLDLCFATSTNRFIKVSRADLAADIARPAFFGWSDLDRFVSRARIRDNFAAGDDLVDLREQLRQVVSPMDNKGGATYMDSQNDDSTVVLSRGLVDRLGGLLDDLADGLAPDGTLTRSLHRGSLETLYFGRFGGELYARIYDKTSEIKRSGKTHMLDIWRAAGWDGRSTVVRVEFSISGDFLKAAGGVKDSGLPNLDLRPFHAFQRAVPALWSYLTGSWLRLTVPNGDNNRWRWELDPFWEVVQTAWPQVDPVQRLQPPRRPNTEQLMAQIRGCILTATAIRSRVDADSNRTGLQVLTELLEEIDGQRFDDCVLERRMELGIDDFSDTAFSSSARSQSLLDGMGS